MRKGDKAIITIYLKDNGYYNDIDVYVYGRKYSDFDEMFGHRKEQLISVLEELVYHLKEFGYPYYCYYPNGG